MLSTLCLDPLVQGEALSAKDQSSKIKDQSTGPLRVVILSPEAVPFAKVGGLADVLGALPLALEKLGVSVTVAIPRYGLIDLHKFGFEPYRVPGDGRVRWLLAGPPLVLPLCSLR